MSNIRRFVQDRADEANRAIAAADELLGKTLDLTPAAAATASATQETTASMPLDNPTMPDVHSLSVNELADVFDELMVNYLADLPVTPPPTGCRR